MIKKHTSRILGILTLAFILQNIVHAADIPIETYISGSVELQLNGSWDTGINLNQVYPKYIESEDFTTDWEKETTDYISFVDDDTTENGFHITLSQTDFIYSGSSQTQTDIPAANSLIIANYDSQTAQAPSLGDDDPSKTLSVLPDSCESTDTGDFSFHSDFSDSGKGYALTGSTSAATILTGTNTCLALGHIRFDRVELTVPANSDDGTYTSTLTLTIYDGSS